MATTTVLENLRKSFGEEEVLRGIDLRVEAGSFTVFLGPSGCGKSTTLRCLAGLEEVSSGRIWIGEREVTHLEPRARDIAMVFQNYALYPNMSIERNMGFGLKNQRVPRAEIRRRVRETATLLGMESLLHRFPRELSGGQQQRAAIGRAIVRNPNLFLFDEPLSNLDAKLRVDTRAELIRLHRRLGATSVYVTHDQEEAMTMADRIVVMNEGRVEQAGTPAEIYFQPETLMVASFVGSPTMNFVDGQWCGSGWTTPFGTILGPPEQPDTGSVRIGVRPDDLQPWKDPSSDTPALTAPATVDLVELLGARGIVTVTTAAGEWKMVVEQRRLAGLSPGTEIRLAAPADRLHFFDPASGRRLPGAIPGDG